MIYKIYGDLLKSDCDVIAHQTNCFSKMGSGIAKQIAIKYPEALWIDKHFSNIPQDKLGQCSYCWDNGKIIVNLYGQYNYGKNGKFTNYNALENAINIMMSKLPIFKASIGKEEIKIGMPYKIGCDRGGGDWDTVNRMLCKISKKYKTDIYLYEWRPKYEGKS